MTPPPTLFLGLTLLVGCGGAPKSGVPGPEAPAGPAPDSGGSPADDTATDSGDPVDTAAPVGEGLEGGWRIEHSAAIGEAVFVHPVNTDKDGALVAARLGSALGGLGLLATQDARRAALDPTRMADAAYVGEVTDFIVDDLYGRLAAVGSPAQGLVGTEVLVLSSVHRFGLYAAEALHARVLPLQIMSFASDWSQVEAAAVASTLIVGQDFDYDGLWLWNKLAAGVPGTAAGAVPAAYLRAMAEAEVVVIVQPDDNWATCTETYCSDVITEAYLGADSPIFLHSSLSRSLASNPGTARYAEAAAAGLLRQATEAEVANLKQWEWGVPDSTVDNLRAAWRDLGRDPADLVVVRGGVVDLFAATPRLWAAYLAQNGLSPQGLHFSSYWVAYPQLERAGAALPVVSYTYYQVDWHPLDDGARALLRELCGEGDCPPEVAAGSRAFVNTIGSASDAEAVRAVMEEHGLSEARGAWYGLGVNALGAGDWTGWSGETVEPGWERVAMDLGGSPYWGRTFLPLSVAELCEIVPCE